MWKLFHEIKQFAERCTLNFHRCVLSVEYNAVLIVIYIRRVLKKPVTAINRYRDDSVILSCRMVHTSCVSLIFLAE